MPDLTSLLAEKAELDRRIHAAAAADLLDSLIEAYEAFDVHPVSVTITFDTDDDGSEVPLGWVQVTSHDDDADIAFATDEIQGLFNDWESFLSFGDSAIALYGRDNLFGESFDLQQTALTAQDTGTAPAATSDPADPTFAEVADALTARGVDAHALRSHVEIEVTDTIEIATGGVYWSYGTVYVDGDSVDTDDLPDDLARLLTIVNGEGDELTADAIADHWAAVVPILADNASRITQTGDDAGDLRVAVADLAATSAISDGEKAVAVFTYESDATGYSYAGDEGRMYRKWGVAAVGTRFAASVILDASGTGTGARIALFDTVERAQSWVASQRTRSGLRVRQATATVVPGSLLMRDTTALEDAEAALAAAREQAEAQAHATWTSRLVAEIRQETPDTPRMAGLTLHFNDHVDGWTATVTRLVLTDGTDAGTDLVDLADEIIHSGVEGFGQWAEIVRATALGEPDVNGDTAYDVDLDDQGPADEEELSCAECGQPMFITDDGVSHHFGGPAGLDDIDHDTDADHVAIADTTPAGAADDTVAFGYRASNADAGDIFTHAAAEAGWITTADYRAGRYDTREDTVTIPSDRTAEFIGWAKEQIDAQWDDDDGVIELFDADGGVVAPVGDGIPARPCPTCGGDLIDYEDGTTVHWASHKAGCPPMEDRTRRDAAKAIKAGWDGIGHRAAIDVVDGNLDVLDDGHDEARTILSGYRGPVTARSVVAMLRRLGGDARLEGRGDLAVLTTASGVRIECFESSWPVATVTRDGKASAVAPTGLNPAGRNPLRAAKALLALG